MTLRGQHITPRRRRDNLRSVGAAVGRPGESGLAGLCKRNGLACWLPAAAGLGRALVVLLLALGFLLLALLRLLGLVAAGLLLGSERQRNQERPCEQRREDGLHGGLLRR